MKKVIILISCVLMSVAAICQSTTPRSGTGVNYDPRKLNYVYASATDATGADSVTLAPNAWLYTYTIALTDSFTLKNPTVTNCKRGDHIILNISGASGTKLKFTGANWIGTGTATLSSGGVAIIKFFFNGSKYVEASRVVQ